MKTEVFVYTYEFGYELSYHTFLRRYKRESGSEIYVCSFKDRRIFYEDFATFIELPQDLIENYSPSNPESFPKNELSNRIKKWLGDVSISFNHDHDFLIFNRLDLEGNGDYIDIPNNRDVTTKNKISFFPRNHTTHQRRNYDIKKLRAFIDRIKELSLEIDLILFNDKYHTYEPLTELNVSGVGMVINPTIQEQINIHSESKYIIYNHSGAAFLPLFNVNKNVPVFIYSTNDDYKRIYQNKNNIHYKKLSSVMCVHSETDNISDIDPDYLYDNFKSFINVT